MMTEEKTTPKRKRRTAAEIVKEAQAKEASAVKPEEPAKEVQQVLAAPAKEKKEIITIMDRQKPFKVLSSSKGHMKGARYKQFGVYFNCGGILLPGQKIVERELPDNVRIIGRI